MIWEFAALERPMQFDILSALEGASVEDDDSLSPVELGNAIAEAMRRTLATGENPPPDQLPELLRRRLVKAASRLDLLQWPGIEPQRGFDLISDRQIARLIAWWVLNEAEAIATEVTMPEAKNLAATAAAEALGTRVLARHSPGRLDLLRQVQRMRNLAAGRPQSSKEARREIADVEAGNATVAPDVDLEALGTGARKTAIGVWVCDAIAALPSVHASRRPPGLVAAAAPAIAEFLAIFIVDPALWRGRPLTDAHRGPVTEAPNNRPLAYTSSDMKSQWSRATQVIAIVSLSSLLYLPDPGDPFIPSRTTKAGR